MEIFLSAVLGELATRSMSFFINKYSKQPAQAMEDNLERILLRAHVIVDEAEGRHITNQGMLRQLSMVRDAMYQGFYVLDTLRYRDFEEDSVEDHKVVNHLWAPSKFSCAKRICLSSSSSNITKTSQEIEVEDVLIRLRTMILDVSELVMLLTTYPRLHCQPYSVHLLMENCMFGRQMEMELVLNFLFHTQPCSGDKFDVLPIVGPGKCGKSTLVAHVCNDERVRDHFSQIVFFRHGTFMDEDIAILTDGCAMRHEQNRKLLIVFEVVGELNEDLWESLCHLSTSRTTCGSKIIITSRSDKITKLGTRQTMILKHLPLEAYWYFFKVITFGSTDPALHPKLTYLAMEISNMLNGSLVAANIIARLLRADFSIQYWCKIMKFVRGCVEKYLSLSGEHPCDLLNENKPTYLPGLGRTSEDVFISGQSQTCSSQEELPKITMHDVLYGGVKPHGTLKVLGWKSPLPPYHCYIYSCEIRQPQLQARVDKRRRSLNNGGIRRV